MLITVGVIGIVAAMTMPSLIANHKKKSISVKLKKFYSVMNQAIKLSEVEYGDAKGWMPDKVENLEDGNFEGWYLKYLDKNIQSLDKKLNSDGYHYNVGFSDGTGFNGYIPINSNIAWIFYCVDYKKCKAESYDGRDTFLFAICDGRLVASGCSYQNKSRASLLYECKNPAGPIQRHACTALIQYDGWEIMPDYPWKS